MDHLAHTALWRRLDRDIGMAVLAPTSISFREAVRAMAIQDAYYDHQAKLTFFSPGAVTLGQGLVARHYGANCCPICLRMANPCWHWRMMGYPEINLSVGQLAGMAMNIPETVDDANRLIAAASNNALNQLTASSANLATALRDLGGSRTLPNRRARMETPRPALSSESEAARDARMDREAERILALLPERVIAPTPAGTIRCNTCHQVIPPGFEKAKDTKKTEDEIYAECEHEWDALGLTCKKCRLLRRDEPIVKLEID